MKNRSIDPWLILTSTLGKRCRCRIAWDAGGRGVDAWQPPQPECCGQPVCTEPNGDAGDR